MNHILLAEDNPGDVLLVRQALDQHHIEHDLQVVKDGAVALDFLSRMGKPGEPACPDLFLLDLNLPKIEGPQVLTEFRKHSACTHTPVIVITSSDAQRDRANLADLGVDRYFRKPSDLDAFMELGGVIEELLSANR